MLLERRLHPHVPFGGYVVRLHEIIGQGLPALVAFQPLLIDEARVLILGVRPPSIGLEIEDGLDAAVDPGYDRQAFPWALWS